MSSSQAGVDFPSTHLVQVLDLVPLVGDMIEAMFWVVAKGFGSRPENLAIAEAPVQ